MGELYPCLWCDGRFKVTAIHVLFPAPRVSLKLCGQCYSKYRAGRLRYYPNSRTFRESL